MAQDPDRKNLDSLTDKEKEELDQSLGVDKAPEELSKKEQEELEEMALEGESRKRKEKKKTFPKKAEVEKPKKEEEEKKEDKKEEPEEKRDQSKSGRHPAISSKDTKPKKWQPKPVQLSDDSVSSGLDFFRSRFCRC